VDTLSFRPHPRQGMPFLDYVSLLLSFFVVVLPCCMLVAFCRLSASLRFGSPKASSRLPSHLRGAIFSTAIGSPTCPAQLSTPSHSTAAMFQRAVNNHKPAPPSQVPAASKQQSLASSFNRPSAAPRASSTRPLSTLSGNATKPNIKQERKFSGQAHGIKRTSSGLAKALGSQEEVFDYSSFNTSDFENNLPSSIHTAMSGKPAPPSTVFFDENDFDSDIDLDVEDPATKTTVHYPTLPSLASASSRDSAYDSITPQPVNPKQEPKSSAPIPWSSSPPEHLASMATAQRPPEPTKRRTLPWLHKSSQTVVPEQLEPETSRPTKRRSVDTAPIVKATPIKKETKSEYPWNATQSALKQQQKSLRESHKATKASEGNDEDMKEAIKKKKKTSIHRIFLSEEQQHVLNLVVEHKKSVFFTGSAGE
jgi:ATP-dependent DNA helicase PIF1